MSKLTGSKKATQFTESVIREMTRLNQLHGGVNLSQGFPDFPAPDGDQGRGVRGDPAPTSISTRSPGARGRCARRSRASSPAATASPVVADEQVTVCCGVDRSDDGDDDGDHRSRRRGGRLRAVLRELRARRDPLRRDAALRHAARAGLDASTPTSSPRRSTTRPRRSSSTRRTTRPARCSRATSSR